MDGRDKLAYILEQKNPFLILDIDEDATLKEVRTAYKKLVKDVHPDRYSDPGLNAMAKEAFIIVGKAHNDLKDPLKRKEYERLLSNLRASGMAPKKSATQTSTSTRPKAPPKPAAKSSPSASNKPSSPPPAKKPEKTAAEKKQELAQKHFNEAEGLVKKNKLDEAINSYQEAIRVNNKEARYHSALGIALDKKGWGGYAQAEYKVALHFDPTDKSALKFYQPTAGGDSVKKNLGKKLLTLFKSGDNKVTRIGDILINKGYLNKIQLKDALKFQTQEKMLLGEILIQKKYIKPEHLASALIAQSETVN